MVMPKGIVKTTFEAGTIQDIQVIGHPVLHPREAQGSQLREQLAHLLPDLLRCFCLQKVGDLSQQARGYT